MFLQRCTVGNAAQTSEKMEVGCSSKGVRLAMQLRLVKRWRWDVPPKVYGGQCSSD